MIFVKTIKNNFESCFKYIIVLNNTFPAARPKRTIPNLTPTGHSSDDDMSDCEVVVKSFIIKLFGWYYEVLSSKHKL